MIKIVAIFHGVRPMVFGEDKSVASQYTRIAGKVALER